MTTVIGIIDYLNFDQNIQCMHDVIIDILKLKDHVPDLAWVGNE